MVVVVAVVFAVVVVVVVDVVVAVCKMFRLYAAPMCCGGSRAQSRVSFENLIPDCCSSLPSDNECSL